MTYNNYKYYTKVGDRVAIDEDDPEFNPSKPNIYGIILEKGKDSDGEYWLVDIDSVHYKIPPERIIPLTLI